MLVNSMEKYSEKLLLLIWGILSHSYGLDKFLSSSLGSQLLSVLLGYEVFSNNEVMGYSLQMRVVNLWI